MQERHATSTYLHGYTPHEQQRLRQQAAMTEALIYQSVELRSVESLLEIGCGVGAQSEILLRRFPQLRLHGVDINEAQILQANANLAESTIDPARYQFSVMNAAELQFPDQQFDAVFICWVLEHINDPLSVLREARRVLKERGVIYLTEVMNSSLLLSPRSFAVDRYWQRFNEVQQQQGGDPYVGAKLGNLLQAAEFRDIVLEPKSFHYDNREPEKRTAMLRYWTGLMLSAADAIRDAGGLNRADIQAMEADMHEREQRPETIFFYSFIQAKAHR
ncbi:class I SAM-dependent methyltransferase [Permianibacter aggregans]|uniref:Methyltransferase family protein n=1 Tax=Permianibacter aggregans TaxID=1510150 RepID=A0A4R6UWR7_9GAMM|nr:class I SAM-dependent methyltransferase [Permianibacter aggregans]QGX40965.1 SAM-dependent methyltransferase [Permianibacter aggregans]TDQ48024.1 methyltransferase family protein [Permianibacter aggregans]